MHLHLHPVNSASVKMKTISSKSKGTEADLSGSDADQMEW